jgi:hypothetical protein
MLLPKTSLVGSLSVTPSIPANKPFARISGVVEEAENSDHEESSDGEV